MTTPAKGNPPQTRPVSKGKPRRRRSGRPWWLIFLVLLLAGAAVAVLYVPIPGLTAPAEDASPAADPDPAQAADPAQVSDPAQVVNVDDSASDALIAREAAVTLKEKELADREAALTEREAKVNELLKELTTQESAAEMIRRLSDIYENMPPAKAAGLLESLETSTAVEILRLIEARQTADILAAMDPDVALELTREMAKPLIVPSSASGNG